MKRNYLKNPINIRLLSGEIWAFLQEARFKGDLRIEQEAFTTIMDVSLGIMARHIGEELADDEGFPVTPLPRRTGEEK